MPTTIGRLAAAVTLAVICLASGCAHEPLATPAPDIGTWSTKAPLLVARLSPGVGVSNGVLYAVSGDETDALPTVEAYDVSTGTWSARAPFPLRHFFVGVGVVDGLLFAVVSGGELGGGEPPQGVPVQAYDPSTDTWSARASVPTTRDFMGVGVVNDVLYVVGGVEYTPPPHRMSGTLNAYDPATDSWSVRASMPTRRSFVGVGTVDGILYVVGGLDDVGTPLTTVEAYDPLTDSWSSRAPVPVASMDGPEIGVVDGILYAVSSGFTDGVPSTTIEAYDPVRNSWHTMAPAPVTRWWPGVGVVNGAMYLVGGYDNRVTYTTVQAFSP